MTSRYLLLLSVLSLGLGSCKSSEKAIFHAIRSNNSVELGRLPRLEAIIEPGPLAATDGALPDDASKVFRQELAFHLAEPQPDSNTYGHARMVVTQAKLERTGRFLQGFQMLTLMTPSLLGLPLEWYRTSVKAEVQILDAKGNLLASYTGTGRSKVRVAMYHGYSQTAAPRVSDVQALRLALDQIRPKLNAASDTLRRELISAGPLEKNTSQSAGMN
ncbi:hypothetical protein [Hymenobacter tenuis]